MRPLQNFPIAASAAVTTSETRSRNAIASTIANEKKRSLIAPRMARPGFGFTPQMVFRASCSSPNTPEAPKSKATTPTMAATTPDDVSSLALLSIAWMASAPFSPTSPLICSTMRPCAASSPNTSAATPTTISSRGASEKVV